MRIKKTRIHNLDRYIKHIAPGTSIKVVAEVTGSSNALSRAGFDEDVSDGTTVLPPVRGPISRFNAEGKWLPDKTKPKESKYIRTVRWKWQQWSGKDQTEDREELRDIYRQCYPGSLIPPPSIELTIREADKKIFIVSPTIDVGHADLKHIINLFLELIGHCELTAEDIATLTPPVMKRVSWQLLPPGEYPWNTMKEHLKFALRKASDGVATVIQDRQETLVSLNPTTIYVGLNGFSDYIAYEFKSRGLVVLESIRRDNAIYVFGLDWESASRLSKKEILDASLQKERIVHSKAWKGKLRAMLI